MGRIRQFLDDHSFKFSCKFWHSLLHFGIQKSGAFDIDRKFSVILHSQIDLHNYEWEEKKASLQAPNHAFDVVLDLSLSLVLNS